MIKISDIESRKVENFHNWFDNPLISQIAVLTKNNDTGSLEKFFIEYQEKVESEFTNFKKDILG